MDKMNIAYSTQQDMKENITITTLMSDGEPCECRFSSPLSSPTHSLVSLFFSLAYGSTYLGVGSEI